MADKIIGKIPEFTKEGDEEVKETSSSDVKSNLEESKETKEVGKVEGQTSPQEKETPDVPPSEEKPEISDEDASGAGDLKEELQHEIEGLKGARKEIILELKELRGQRRELRDKALEDSKEKELAKVEEKIDDLSDVNPEDQALLDRYLKAKGFVSKQGVEEMLYKARRQEEFQKFLNEFPEYNEVNDPDRKLFGPLLREIEMYKDPSDASEYGRILRRAHSAISSLKRSIPAPVQKRQAEVASMGSGGTQSQTSHESFSAQKRAQLLLGGWSEEEINSMENKFYNS